MAAGENCRGAEETGLDEDKTGFDADGTGFEDFFLNKFNLDQKPVDRARGDTDLRATAGIGGFKGAKDELAVVLVVVIFVVKDVFFTTGADDKTAVDFGIDFTSGKSRC